MTRHVRMQLAMCSRASLLFGLAIGALANGDAFDSTDQEPAKWSVPVRVFPAERNRKDSAAETAQPQMGRQPPAPAAGLPPQYQTTRRLRAGRDVLAGDHSLRFIVSLVERPIVVDAHMTTDGEPFPVLREGRIDQLLRQLAEPAQAVADRSAASSNSQPQSGGPVPELAESPPRPDNPILARLRRYASATNRPPSRDEIRWLLANWASGPTVLWLDENYQRVRANASPLFKILDREGDAVLSSEEIRSAAEVLWKCDTNQDEVVSLVEINKAAERTPDNFTDATEAPPLLVLEQLTVAQMFQRLCEAYRAPLRRFDQDGDGAVSESELSELHAAQADVIVQVAFDSKDPSRSRLQVTAIDKSLGDTEPVVRESSITFLSARTLLECSAVQFENVPASDQVSLGAVRDGYPMLPGIDANEDGRLTIREVRLLSKRLATFDRDGDGRITRAELPPTLRVSFGLGPTVHRHLATVRGVRPTTPPPSVRPPEWFTRMDRNEDGDVSPREFLGDKEQFAALDTDKDELISVAEANAGETP